MRREATDDAIHFGLVRNEHLAHDAKTACLPQQHEPERIDVNDQRDLPESCLRLAARAPREPLVPMWVEHERE
jgi:hypothetical protein